MLLKHIRGICKGILQIALLFINCLLFTGCITVGPTSLALYSSQYIPSSLKGTPKENLAQITWQKSGFVQIKWIDKLFTIDGVNMKSWGRGNLGHKIYLAEGKHTFTHIQYALCHRAYWVDNDQLIRVWGVTYDVIDSGWVVFLGGGTIKGYFTVSAGEKYNWYNGIPLNVTDCDCENEESKLRPNKLESPLAEVLPIEKYTHLKMGDGVVASLIDIKKFKIVSNPDRQFVAIRKSPDFENYIGKLNIVNIDEFKKPALFTAGSTMGRKRLNLIRPDGARLKY